MFELDTPEAPNGASNTDEIDELNVNNTEINDSETTNVNDLKQDEGAKTLNNNQTGVDDSQKEEETNLSSVNQTEIENSEIDEKIDQSETLNVNGSNIEEGTEINPSGVDNNVQQGGTDISSGNQTEEVANSEIEDETDTLNSNETNLNGKLSRIF